MTETTKSRLLAAIRAVFWTFAAVAVIAGLLVITMSSHPIAWLALCLVVGPICGQLFLVMARMVMGLSLRPFQPWWTSLVFAAALAGNAAVFVSPTLYLTCVLGMFVAVVAAAVVERYSATRPAEPPSIEFIP